MPETMKTIEISEFGDAGVLVQGQRLVPTPQPNEVLLQISAAGVNGPDLLQRRGHYPPPAGASDLLGLEVSGTVIAKGVNVEQWDIGAEVCALTNGGGYAEYVCIHADHCLPIPNGVSLRDAAGLCETYFTVWSNLFHGQAVPKGANLLVHGGAGGIGSTAIQLAKAMGLNVLTTCSGAADHKFVQNLGADCSIDYRNEDFVEVVRQAGGADVILDIIGGDYIARNLKAAKPDARIVQLAFNAGSQVDINLMPIMLKRLTLTGSTLRSRPTAYKSAIAKDLAQSVWPMFDAGKLRVEIHAALPFDQAAQAHKLMEAGDHRGKILLTP